MAGALTALADAIKDSLNGTQFSVQFEASRSWIPAHSLDELQSVRVTVVPKSREIAGETRGATAYDYAIDVGIQARAMTDDEADVMNELVEEIMAHLNHRHFDGFKFMGLKNDPVLAAQHMIENHVFTSVVTVQYRELK